MKTKTAVLSEEPDAGNPHVWFDEGGVASAKPWRGSLLYNVHLCVEGSGCSRWFAAGVLFLFALPALAEPLSVTCRIVREDGASETRACPLVVSNRVAVLRLSAAEVGPAKAVELEPSFAVARTGDPGYYVTPEGLYGRFHERNGQLKIGQGRNYMPMYGMKTPQATFVAIAKKMSWRYETRVVATNGVYRMFQRYDLGGDAPYEDFEIAYSFLPDDAEYPAMARAYRAWQLERGACKPIRERMKDRPELAAAATNVEIRIRQGWKPVPSPVLYQTRLNEPKVHAAVTFDRCQDIVRELKRQGVDHAEICLVGWNKGGHDGAVPQLFPVEPALGGEGRLRAFIDCSNAAGFQTVCHTCFYSAYTIADDWDEEYLLKERDGSLQASPTPWGGGRAFRTCPQRAYEKWVRKNMQMIRDLGFHGLHYHDVYSILPPRVCYDPRHPCDPVRSTYWTNRQMEETRRQIGGAQSEGPFDHWIGNLDYAMYVNFYSLDNDFAKKPMVDGILPIWMLVYHGITLANPFTGTLNYPIKAPHKRLKFVEFGGRPLFVWYANFHTGKGGDWMGKEDLRCGTDEELRAGVAAIKRGYDEYERLADLQFAFMDDHRMLTPTVSRTTYSNGTRVIVNHGTTPYVFEGREVPAGDWLRVDEVHRGKDRGAAR